MMTKLCASLAALTGRIVVVHGGDVAGASKNVGAQPRWRWLSDARLKDAKLQNPTTGGRTNFGSELFIASPLFEQH